MSNKNQPSLRIDWFDGTVIEESRSNAPGPSFDDEDAQSTQPTPKPLYSERKLMGFKRLSDLSQQDASNLTLQLSDRSSFWELLNSDLKDDFIVLITKILAKLYSSLQSGQKSLMLTKLLKTRLLTSVFVDKLEHYIVRLPGTRIVEKRMNMQFWDEVEPFFDNVLAVCNGVLDQNPERNKIIELLEAVKLGVSGLMEEHKEQFSEELFLKMDDLEKKLGSLDFLDPAPQPTQSHPRSLDQNFRNLNIFPSREDLLGKTASNIVPNIVNGAYTSVEHYLDVQFKLLREDCFGPLREGISKYMENPTKRRHENIRVHPKVRFIRTYVSNNRVGYLVDIAWKERDNQLSKDSKKYAYNKQLMFGSLLLFTSDNFERVLCATVLDSNLHLLSEGYLAISFHSPVSNKIFSESYLMIESEVFFEPYHRVLKVLQNSKTDDLPMRRYIVDVQPGTRPPTYLNSETYYTLPQNNKEDITFPALDLLNWPSEQTFGLDSSQMEAYKLALTREFAVIQGPPGTGKTFIGVKVATTILQNLSLEGTPMLIICYTNHALDQFLEGVLKVTKNVLRLGSQSKNEKIEPYTLNNLRMKSKSKHSYLYRSKRAEQEKLYKEMMEIQGDIEKCDQEILTYKTIKPYLKANSKNLELKSCNEDPILKWLFGNLEKESNKEILGDDDDDDDLDDWEKQLDEFDEKIYIENEKLDTCFSEHSAMEETDSMYNSIKYVKDVTDDQTEQQKMADKFQAQIDKVRIRLRHFKKALRQYQDGLNNSKNLDKVTDLDSLPTEDRWSVYFTAVTAVKDKLMGEMKSLQDKYNVSTEELEEVSTLVDAEVVKTSRVVGVTTTTAARRHQLLQTVRSPIVIVEEAAEVLEAHVVACLTQHCQHVILIGDHKQLRPTAAHYKLAKHYNLEISLFERMIRNGVHARTLTTQRRMRPNFVELIVPIVYERLDSHPSVYKYENVKGMKHNLFFVTHSVFEDEGMEDSWSHKNRFEAKWCVALANYLSEKNYISKDITILATYAGQVSLIKELSKKHPNLRDVKTTVVDNFQGEESRIVILSLVRSNREAKIGFLAAQDRICVALSRAKEGFYMFGNMDVLKSASHIWGSIDNNLASQKAIGKSLSLCCDNHPENIFEVQNVEDFENCLQGSCLRICDRNNKLINK